MQFHIGNSTSSCIPFTPASATKGSHVCAACGIESVGGMEKHLFGKNFHSICPICHCCRHLNSLQVKNAGIMIWLPEIEQTKLNALVSVIFAAMEGEEGEIEDQYVSRFSGLYKTFESRSMPIAALFGGENPLYDGNSPLFMAQQIDMANRVFAKEPDFKVSERIEGIRFLAKPASFTTFIAGVKAVLDRKHPRDTWSDLLQQD